MTTARLLIKCIDQIFKYYFEKTEKYIVHVAGDFIVKTNEKLRILFIICQLLFALFPSQIYYQKSAYGNLIANMVINRPKYPQKMSTLVMSYSDHRKRLILF